MLRTFCGIIAILWLVVGILLPIHLDQLMIGSDSLLIPVPPGTPKYAYVSMSVPD